MYLGSSRCSEGVAVWVGMKKASHKITEHRPFGIEHSLHNHEQEMNATATFIPLYSHKGTPQHKQDLAGILGCDCGRGEDIVFSSPDII